MENAHDQTLADPGLLRIVARAHDIQERLMQNTDLTVHVVASQERVSANYIYRLLRLPTLAPASLPLLSTARTHRTSLPRS